ncbi:ornithine carbamoyltransferase [Alicyclobacillus sp. TC]|uniref:Ornithine carbamoyltransferase n=2 Tax=Alicyclobacillus tolerans TaxID=90970 RepID=A0ABT9LVL6_9BACL|nr:MULTISPECIES: ornithine carbamoyltransferase [Alicyclobacillus]MDP9728318.1 ornithine carbamoyltransferase [Alicyclobacillus tengchongensis]QRF23887.1 ornithine carbamoyltransferase [Alicyclobacillus sp. TC]SHJ94697.1 ornithine carbamoyltransferase [Alicyclobacillus montanus]
MSIRKWQPVESIQSSVVALGKGYLSVRLQTALFEAHRSLRGRHLLDFSDITSEELKRLLQLAHVLKEAQKSGFTHHLLQGKTLAMIFDKASTRTRVSFEVGMSQLGGSALFLSSEQTQLSRGEPLPDTARVLSRYVDGIMVRTFAHASLQELASYATVPVINGLTDEHHPCQLLADVLTLEEHFGSLAGLTVAYVGDGNNLAHSWLQIAPKLGIHIRVATPPGYSPLQSVVDEAKMHAVMQRSQVLVTTDAERAVTGADVIYTDVWTSMGDEEEYEERLQVFAPYQVNANLVSKANPNYLFLHCLPAHRGEEVSAEIIDGPHSKVFDQAENRLHAQKAVLAALMADAGSFGEELK